MSGLDAREAYHRGLALGAAIIGVGTLLGSLSPAERRLALEAVARKLNVDVP